MGTWTAVAEAYRTSFATLCSGPLERLLADTAGDLHLDVGCGTGELAARATADGRRVIAADADPDMVAITAAGHRDVVQAALPSLPFANSRFDALTANFVVNHVPDPRAATGELARVLRPGGRLAATIWPAGPTSWGALVSDAFAAVGARPLAGRRLSPELDFERSVDGLRSLVQGAGLQPVTASELHWEWRITVDDLWTGIAGGVAAAGQAYLAQPPHTQAAIESEFRRRATAVAREGCLCLPQKAAYVVAAR